MGLKNIPTKLVTNGFKNIGKKSAKTVIKNIGRKLVTNGVKNIGKQSTKTVIKAVPIVGIIAGLGLGIYRAFNGDWFGAVG